MKKTKLFCLVMLCAVSLLTACNNEKENEPPIKVDNEEALNQTVFADATSGNSSISFTTAGAWTSTIKEISETKAVYGPPSWIGIDPDHGDKADSYTININLEGNTSGKDRMAEIIFACNGTNIILSFTQKGTKSDGTIYEPNVYVVGYESPTYYQHKAKLWKHGIAQYLSGDDIRDTKAHSVYLSGADIYIAGGGGDYSGGAYYGILWKNGVEQRLLSDDAARSEARSVFVSGGNVYVAGYENAGYFALNRPTLWKNGVAQTLTSITSAAEAFSVCTSGNDVYVAIGDNDTWSAPQVAVLWKNGNIQSYGRGEANSVYVVSDDVYVAGESGGKAILWKNGEAQSLAKGNRANSVFVYGKDVYVAGSGVNEHGEGVAILWKNGEAQSLSDGTTNHVEVKSVYVSNGDVYVVGYEENSQKKRVAKLWKNGVARNLSDGTIDTQANSVFVK